MSLSGPLLMDARTFLAQPQQSDVDYDTEHICMSTTNIQNNLVSWTASKDGFIIGWMSSAASQFCITIGVVPPTTSIVAGSVATGAVWYSSSVNPGSSWNGGLPSLRHRFLSGDQIYLRTLAAAQVVLWLFVGYPKIPT